MKKILFLGLFLSSILSYAQETTTYYLIRHAEKDRTDAKNRDPLLNPKGLKRADHWAQVLGAVKFDLVYSTNYNRTKQTATPTARANNLELLFYNPSKMYDASFVEKTKGKNVLIVGHSNTTPAFVNKILGENKYQDIDDNNNNNLYIVTVTKESTASTVLYIPFKE